MLESGTRTSQAATLDRNSRARKAQRAERILGLVLWLGFAVTVLFFVRA